MIICGLRFEGRRVLDQHVARQPGESGSAFVSSQAPYHCTRWSCLGTWDHFREASNPFCLFAGSEAGTCHRSGFTSQWQSCQHCAQLWSMSTPQASACTSVWQQEPERLNGTSLISSDTQNNIWMFWGCSSCRRGMKSWIWCLLLGNVSFFHHGVQGNSGWCIHLPISLRLVCTGKQ